MPLIDVTELFTDPDFATTFDVARSSAGVSTHGRTVEVLSSFPAIVGSVQPAGATSLQRLPEGSNLSGAIEIYTTFRLTNGSRSAGTEADVVTWQGADYTVMDVSDWTQFGAGFIQAVCTIAVEHR